MNIDLANVLYNMYQSVWKILEEYSEKTVDIIKQGAEVREEKKVGWTIISSLLSLSFLGVSAVDALCGSNIGGCHQSGYYSGATPNPSRGFLRAVPAKLCSWWRWWTHKPIYQRTGETCSLLSYSNPFSAVLWNGTKIMVKGGGRGGSMNWTNGTD